MNLKYVKDIQYVRQPRINLHAVLPEKPAMQKTKVLLGRISIMQLQGSLTK